MARASSASNLTVIDPGTSHPPNDPVIDDRMHDAAKRSIASSRRLCNKAQQLTEELEDVTPTYGIPIVGLPEEDSMVTSIQAVIEQHKRG